MSSRRRRIRGRDLVHSRSSEEAGTAPGGERRGGRGQGLPGLPAEAQQPLLPLFHSANPRVLGWLWVQRQAVLPQRPEARHHRGTKFWPMGRERKGYVQIPGRAGEGEERGSSLLPPISHFLLTEL